MFVHEILEKVNLGNSVAELDLGLPQYFLMTDSYNRFVHGNIDMIAGEKGTGKTAIYKFLQQSKSSQPELSATQIIPGINPSGEPLFRRFGEEERLTEGQYITVWKLYFLSLIVNWLLKNAPKPASRNLTSLETLLRKMDLISVETVSPGSVFPRLMTWLRNQIRPKAVGMDISFNEMGFPVYTPKVELGQGEPQPEKRVDGMFSHSEVFHLLEEVLVERNLTIWILMDRLDESFIGRPDIEIPALRALIRTFMDFLEYPHIKLKLFVRKDLFRKITQDGFVNLTHVNARKVDIIWDDEDLLVLLCQRIKTNHELLRKMGLRPGRTPDTQLFHAFFCEKMEVTKKQLTWTWMLNQIRDGTGVKAPRNLIDLCTLALEEQLRKERRAPREYNPQVPLIESDSIKKAASRLSSLRLEDTLMAEYAKDVKVLISAFRNSKAEHNDQSISKMFHVDVEQARLYARALLDIGFFEAVGDTYKIPFLYRAGLEITQGKAFNDSKPSRKNHFE